jgi:hypothetical protein
MHTNTIFECNNDNKKGLLYDGLSIVFMQIFSIDFPKVRKKLENLSFNETCINIKPNETKFVKKDDDAIDQQIFINSEKTKPVSRYKLKGFDFKINLEEPYEVSLEGHMFVEMSLFFNKTISLSYRMVIDGKHVISNKLLTTDHLIAIISMVLSAEHWNVCDDANQTNINFEIDDINIGNLFVNSKFEWDDNHSENCVEINTSDGLCNALKKVFVRYKECVLRMCGDTKYLKKKNRKASCSKYDMLYAYVDVWESIKHYDKLFQTIKEEDIISHIVEHHKRELVGLMSLYPAEWSYRTIESFGDVCGSNVAIDSDDLILVNQNVCVVFGTYGLRGGNDVATDWEKHLKERSDRYHVSWPEYLLILEMVLAKKYTISNAKDKLLNSVLCENAFAHPAQAIENNAMLNLEITQLLMKLNAVKYSKFVSHKIMFDRTRKRLTIDEDTEKLENTMERIDKSLQNIRETKSLRQSTLLNIVLGGVSVGALFQIIFMDTHIPFLHSLGLQSEKVGFSIIGLTIFLIFTGALTLLIYLVNTGSRKRK